MGLDNNINTIFFIEKHNTLIYLISTQWKKTAANSLALSYLKLYLISPLINFYFQYLKFNTLFSTDRLCYILFFIFFNPSFF